MYQTLIEQYDSLIDGISQSLKKYEEELSSCELGDPKIPYLQEEIERTTSRLSFIREQRDEEAATGKVRYVYPFGSLEYFKQMLDDSETINYMFVIQTKNVLERAEKPSKKVKYMENLVNAYSEVTNIELL